MFVVLLQNALSLSITEKSTWSDIHGLLITTSTIASQQTQRRSISSTSAARSPRRFSESSRQKGKRKSKKSKGQSKGKGSSQNQPQKGKGKKGQSKGKQNQKEKVNGPHGQVNLGHGIRIRVKVKVEKAKEKDIKYVLIAVVKVIQLINVGGHRKLVLQEQFRSKTGVQYLSSAWGSFVAVMPTDQLRGFQDLRPVHQQQSHQSTLLLTTSSSSAVSSVFASGQGQGFSGHHLRINHFTSDVSEDYIMEVNISNPIYDIGPSLPQECQEPWAALIDTGAVASIAPQSFVPHIPIKEKSETSRVSMVVTSKSWASSMSLSSLEKSSFMSTSSL